MQITQLLRKESQKVHVTNKGGKGYSQQREVKEVSVPMAKAVRPQWAQEAGRQVSDSHLLPNTSETLCSIYNVRTLDKTDFKIFSSHKIILSV